ncbi:MAG: dTDP-glucose 4,6-dehydratase [Proteobacteria bacterium]|nr:dTDP-glucose 4,6-dehydratase [Pseudomonadota bacterium]
MKNKRRVLVTGGCGFIGANFVRLLHSRYSDWRVVNLDKLTYAGNLKNLEGISEGSEYRFVRGDICDKNLISRLFAEECFDTVVHFAAESHVDRSITGPGTFVRTNIEGTFTLLEAARKSGFAGNAEEGAPPCFLHVSTDEVYGSLGQTGYFTENTAYDPRSPYSASKASSDHLARAYFHTYGLPVRITNCSNNYGPFQFPEKLIPLVFNNALNNKALPVYGDGKNVRDWLYVLDHCEAIVEVLEKGQDGQCYNIGGNNEKQNIEVVTLICDLLDKKLGLAESGQPRRSLIDFVPDRLGHDRRYAIDATKIREQLGWEPRVNFAEGMERTVEWYLANQPWVIDIVNGSYQKYYAEMYRL